jgi:hypothetical protein
VDGGSGGEQLEYDFASWMQEAAGNVPLGCGGVTPRPEFRVLPNIVKGKICAGTQREADGGWSLVLRKRGNRSSLWAEVYAVTREPSFSPSMTRRMLPRSRMEKMIIGRLLSLQRETAVVSITLRPSLRMSM